MKAKSSENQEKALQMVGEDQTSNLTVLVCRIVCIVFALLEAWSQRRFINEDGISYLDMSDALIRHNWHLLINPIWSPLYPLLIGLATWLTRPSAQWEVPIVHALNFVIFLGALASFEYLLRQVIRVLRRENGREDTDSAAALLPVWAWQLLGYSFFAWSTIGMIWAPRMITPDLCVAIFVYLDAGLLLSLRDSTKQLRTCLLLGLTLGLGYLAKAILFPMAFLFMSIAFLMIGDWKKAMRPLAVTFLVFCVVAAPLVILMSKRVGRLSYSEAGNMNYAWVVNQYNPYDSSSGSSPALKHPMTLLHRDPDVFGFREPLPLTYPPRSDMGYWSAGAHVTISPRNQLQTIRKNLTILLTNVHIAPMCILIGGGILLLVSLGEPRRFRRSLRGWPLLVPGAAAPCLYLLVFIEPRYVAPFLVLLLLGLFPGILFRNPKDAAKRTVIPTVAVASSMMVLTALLVVYHLAGFPRSVSGLGELFLQAGESLNTAGVRPGEDVGIIGGGVIGDSSGGCRWARMARVRIVAQMPSKEAADFFRLSSPSLKAEVYDAFARAGAMAVVTELTPPPSELTNWEKLGDTHYYVRFLVSSASK